MDFLKIRFLRIIIFVSIIIICLQVSMELFYTYPSFIKTVPDDIQDEATRVAEHLYDCLLTLSDSPENFSPATKQSIITR